MAGQFLEFGLARMIHLVQRCVAMLTPPNDRDFVGTSLGADGTGPPTSSNGSTVYATGDEAVGALLALGIKPVS